MITLFGATGHTGKLTAAALDRLGLPYRIAGRSASRLEQLSSSLPSHPAWVVADAAEPQSLPGLCSGTQVLINCVGPFTDLGERVLRQAALSGVHYLDSTNELGFVYRMQTYDRLAAQSKAVLAPACAFEVALADCAAASLAHVFPGPFDEMSVVYHLPGAGSSRGTRRSALRSLATSWIAYRDGHWVGTAPASRSRRLEIDGRSRYALCIPSSESITLPAHLDVKTVSVWMTVSAFAGIFGPVFIPFFARFLRSIAGPLIQKMVRPHLHEKPAGGAGCPYVVEVTALKGRISRKVTITGCDPYQTTANILAQAAGRALEPGFKLKGLVTPYAILGDRLLVEAAPAWGIQVNLAEGITHYAP